MISLINAGPGTGKTYSLVYGYLKIRKEIFGEVEATPEQQEIFSFLLDEFKPSTKICFFAHSNSNKDTLIKRIGRKNSRIMTFHGEGLSCIIKKYGYQKLVWNRTERHIQAITGQELKDMDRDQKKYWYAIKRILHYLKIEAMEPTEENLAYITMKYPDMASYSIPDEWQPHTEELLERSFRPDGEVEFADMVSIGKRCITRPRYDLGLVDESQDVSRSTYQLVTRLCKHVVFCGDKNQAINAFAGASEEMYDSIAGKSQYILPLKTTLRCPPSICDLANSVRPGGVLLGPNTCETENKQISLNDLPSLLSPLSPKTTLLVSRTNAAVIGTCLFLYKKDCPARIIDKDLGDELKKFIKSFGTTSLQEVKKRLGWWEERGARSRNPMWQQITKDKAAAVRSLMAEVSSFKSLLELIEDTYEKNPNGHRLTTIHKAKGMEAENVFILNPPIELPAAMAHPIGAEQEKNLHFVAVTRSSKNIYWVN